MKLSAGTARTGWLCWQLLTATVLQAEEPAKKAEVVKPAWQRMLGGEDATKAAEQEKNLNQLQEAGQLAEALKIAEALAELRTKVQGEDHWEAVNARFRLETIRRVLSADNEEKQSYRRSIAQEREAQVLQAKGRHHEAQPLLEQVLVIRRKVLGEEHPDTASSYNSLAFNLYVQGKSSQAMEGFRKALTIRRKALGEQHPDTALSYNNVAMCLNSQSKYKEAEEDLRKALATRRKVLGEEHPDTALNYINLAANLSDQGKYKEAEEDLRKALAIHRKLQGEEHTTTAQSYNNLAFNLYSQGKYREAEEGFRKALAIHRRVLGEEHPNTAVCYNNVAMNLKAQSKYKEAEEGLRKALAIHRKVLGEEHTTTALSSINLAGNLSDQGKYKEAEEDLRKALAILRKALGEEHLYTALSYNNLALSLYSQGKYREAEEDLRKALAIRRKVLGEEHPSTAACYNNLAQNLTFQGKFSGAEDSFRKALAIHRKELGEEHPSTAVSYNNLAFNLSYQGRYKEAENLWRSAAESFTKARLHVAVTGLERAGFTSKNSPLPALAALLAHRGKPDDAWQRFEESLARGAWDDLVARLRRPESERDQHAQIDTRIDRLQKLIQRVSVARPSPQQSKQREELLSQLRQAYDDLATFTQQSERKFGPIAGQIFARSQIQAALPTDAAFIAWLDIEGQPKAADPNGEHWAILLRSSGPPIWVRLRGSGDKDDWTDADTRLPTRLRAALQSPGSDWQSLAARLRLQRLDPLAPYLKGVHRLIVLPSTALAGVPVEAIADGYTVSYAHSGTIYAHLLRQPALTSKGLLALADPVFDPPTEHEKPQSLPPSGILLTMVLPGSNAALAGLKPNDVLLRYGDADLADAKDLKPQPESSDPDQRVPLLVWRDGSKLPRPLLVRPGKLGVVFAQEPAPQALAEQHRVDRVLASRGGDEVRWDRLPATRFEVASLKRLFDDNTSAQVLFDSQSSEQRLNELAQSGVLGKYRFIHLATHGEVNADFPLRSAVILSRDHLPDDKQRTELLLSGQPIPDGRLTAEEALQRWNLNCDMVTLSACQTALGKYERGEGYVGFAQALILCGTRSVCLSLWKVDDVATALLMERFYENLLGKRAGLTKPMAKAEALREAKAWLRELPRAEALKRAASLSEGVMRGSRKKLPPLELPPADKTNAKNPFKSTEDRPFAHPYYWAAFVLTGAAD